jgi:hypothetical protein
VVEVSRVEVEVEDGVVKFARARAHRVHELIRHVMARGLSGGEIGFAILEGGELRGLQAKPRLTIVTSLFCSNY